MTTQMYALLGAFVLAVWLLGLPLGYWLAAIADGAPRRLARVERWLLDACGVPRGSQGWRAYAASLLLFNAIGAAALYLLLRAQHGLPLNPRHLPGVAPDTAFNTAISFVTNTNWQAYSGETTMSHLAQMLGLTVQNFLSAATGIAVAFALIRGFARSGAHGIGNFWEDLTRITLYLLLPASLLLALLFAGQGVIQNFSAGVTGRLIEPLALSGGGAIPTQQLAMGPVASQEAIKLLGTNGGGFMNANSAHPFENPTAWTNALQMLAILVIPAGLCIAFGVMVGERRQGWALLAAMTALFVAAVLLVMPLEQAGNPKIAALGIDAAPSAWQAGGNMEGKEVRFGIAASALFAAVTTAASCGAVNAMHASLMPLAGGVAMLLMQLGEVVFGGVGSGLYGMLLFALLAVFVAALMTGRTPEYLGKKIEPAEMKLVSLAILVTPVLVLLGSAMAVGSDAGRAGPLNPGAAGFSEILYAFSSAANNNGSAFAGLSANTPFYNFSLALAMAGGRFAVIVPVLALAGTLARRTRSPRTPGTDVPAAMPTHGPMFVLLLTLSVVLIGALTYLPALALGPMVEHLDLFR
ncbi:MAG: potassium-transporting ATPase subunit KdpA [Gammaproteobacteria bacterium]|nr:potassium-transporting ATPase subunit KdpA [Gammaproteobacteria bacterium]MBU0771118.1 potassium-transporting ATPase subunit KdpA [Gammaproteobacteria bacterium]MBU0855861.1 potassium-transporting ATPase subunit KdpA [Gammaproteobacteria bacterium]MBU1849069.1 potassium-transporting ATPase subunit KdpA [Gammaproteobacteria bacterium]